MSKLIWVAFWSVLWCAGHSWFVTRRWRAVVHRLFPRWHVAERSIYVIASCVSLAVLVLWFRAQPARPLWNWPGWWAAVRWVGLAEAFLLFWLGARAYDNHYFLGLSQLRGYVAGRSVAAPSLSTDGILGLIRHPWYAGGILFTVFCLPWTDVNLVWRGVFLAYLLIGCELEERKLLVELGDSYAEYRRQVGRYLPRLGKWNRK